MQKILHSVSIFIGATLLLCSLSAHAKDTAVLLPVMGPLTPGEISGLTQIAIGSLSPRYELKFGQQVDRVVKQAFAEESKKKDCDEINCYRQIATKFNAEFIIAIRLSRSGADRLLIAYNLFNVLTGEVVASRQRECHQCTFDALREQFSEILRFSDL